MPISLKDKIATIIFLDFFPKPSTWLIPLLLFFLSQTQVAFCRIDPHFAKQQLTLILREWFVRPMTRTLRPQRKNGKEGKKRRRKRNMTVGQKIVWLTASSSRCCFRYQVRQVDGGRVALMSPLTISSPCFLNDAASQRPDPCLRGCSHLNNLALFFKKLLSFLFHLFGT